MSFTQEVKSEVSKHGIDDVSKIPLLSAILSNSIIEKEKAKIVTENASLARFLFSLIKEVLLTTSKITVRNGYNYHKKLIYILEIKESKIKEKLGISKYLIPEHYIIDDEDALRNYIKGVFFITGSINDPKKSRYHLEFLVDNKKYAYFFSNLLNEYELGSKVLKRQTKYMIYIKEAEKIGDFLRIIEATSSLLYYEDIRIYRDHKNMTNRLNNCEQANVERTIETANSQIHDIEIIEKEDSLDLFDEKIKQIAFYRKKYPDSSLQELSDIITLETGKLITKSGVNHRMKKITDLAKKIRALSNKK